jgi:hypothetical protein
VCVFVAGDASGGGGRGADAARRPAVQLRGLAGPHQPGGLLQLGSDSGGAVPPRQPLHRDLPPQPPQPLSGTHARGRGGAHQLQGEVVPVQASVRQRRLRVLFVSPLSNARRVLSVSSRAHPLGACGEVIKTTANRNPTQLTRSPRRLMVTRFAASLRTDNCPLPKEAQPLSHALTSD